MELGLECNNREDSHVHPKNCTALKMTSKYMASVLSMAHVTHFQEMVYLTHFRLYRVCS